MAIAADTAGKGPTLEKPVVETEVEGGTEEVSVNALRGMFETMQKRINDQSKLIAGLQKQKTETPEIIQEPLKGAAGIQALEQKAIEREARATQRAVTTGILSAMVEAGFAEDAARKLLPAMQKEGKFEVNDLDEVIVEDGSGARPVKDFVQLMLKKDDWRALAPTKKAPDKPIHGRPVVTGSTVGPNEHGTFSGAALRAARQG